MSLWSELDTIVREIAKLDAAENVKLSKADADALADSLGFAKRIRAIRKLGYDPANDGPEVNLIRYFRGFPDGSFAAFLAAEHKTDSVLSTYDRPTMRRAWRIMHGLEKMVTCDCYSNPHHRQCIVNRRSFPTEE